MVINIMSKINPFKIGFGAGAVLIGIYLAFSDFSVWLNIFGLVLIAIGIGIVASN